MHTTLSMTLDGGEVSVADLTASSPRGLVTAAVRRRHSGDGVSIIFQGSAEQLLAIAEGIRDVAHQAELNDLAAATSGNR